MTDKWEQLRSLIEATLSHNVQYSQGKAFNRYPYQRVLIWMDDLDKKERERKARIKEISKIAIETHHETLKALEDDKPFLYTGIPTFDQKAWDRIIEEKGLQGLS
jgi:hypothetical protein